MSEKSKSYEERELKDSKLIEEVLKAAEMAAEKSPELVEITTESGYNVIRVKSNEPGVHERKEHKPGTCLEPGRD